MTKKIKTKETVDLLEKAIKDIKLKNGGKVPTFTSAIFEILKENSLRKNLLN